MRKLLLATVIGSAFAAGQHFADLGDGNADLPEIDSALPQRGTSAPAPEPQNPKQPITAAPAATDLASAESQCFSAAELQVQTRADACDLLVAATDDAATRHRALRRYGQAVGEHDPDSADERYLMAAAAGDGEALVEFAQAGLARDPSGRIHYREALLAVADQMPEARVLLDRWRAAVSNEQSLSRPDFLIAMLEARPLDIPDDERQRRYAMGFSQAVERSCPFEAAAVDTAGYRKSRDQYSAPLRTAGHLRMAGAFVEAAGTTVKAVGGFASEMATGRGYTEAGGEFLRQWREAQRTVAAAGSTGSQDGARDAVRAVNLIGGCGNPDGLRLIRGLQALFEARAMVSPRP